MAVRTIAAALLAVIFGSAGPARAAPSPPTQPIELSRYLGRWYEIARVPNQFERGSGCLAPTADYHQEAGKIAVTQVCHVGSPTGTDKVYRANGRILDPGVNARLKLTYYLVFSKEYWILDHAADYGWAIVGDPTGRFLWFLARTPDLPTATRDELVSRAKALGYDTGRLEFPVQR